jgi:uncharacterized protein
MAEFEIKVQELDEGGKQYDFPIRPEWLGSVLRDLPEGDGPLRPDPAHPQGDVSVWAEKSGEDVVVRGRVRTHVLAECSRCLADAPVPVDVALSALFTSKSDKLRPRADAEEITPDEIDTEVYSGEHVVLDALVREHVLLEVPMQPLCKDTCAGLEVPESVRGPSDVKKVDPRLAPLEKLIKKN